MNDIILGQLTTNDEKKDIVLHETRVKFPSLETRTCRREPPPPPAFPKLSESAMPGWIGNFVKAATENSEADPAAVLFQLLTGSASMFGSKATFKVGDKTHYARVNTLIYGGSARARKGTSFAPVDRVLKATNEKLLHPLKVTSGPLASGEGLIFAVRDASDETDNDGSPKDGGIADKRLLVVEEEFASALKVSKREGNTLSTIVRALYDSGDIEPLTKTSRIKTTGAHVCLIGHITPKDLAAHLCEADVWNGFANRFLFVCARRPQLVPIPRAVADDVINSTAERLASACKSALSGLDLRLTPEAEQYWTDLYSQIAAERAGIVGVVTARAEAHVLRLAAIYALLDSKRAILPEHLKSATHAWSYCQDSAEYIFGTASDLDDAEIRILGELDKEGSLSQTDVHHIFKNNQNATSISNKLRNLEERRLIRRQESRHSKGKPTTTWFLTPEGSRAFNS